MKRSRPRQHKRKLKSGRIIVVNKGRKKKVKRRSLKPLEKEFRKDIKFTRAEWETKPMKSARQFAKQLDYAHRAEVESLGKPEEAFRQTFKKRRRWEDGAELRKQISKTSFEGKSAAKRIKKSLHDAREKQMDYFLLTESPEVKVRTGLIKKTKIPQATLNPELRETSMTRNKFGPKNKFYSKTPVKDRSLELWFLKRRGQEFMGEVKKSKPIAQNWRRKHKALNEEHEAVVKPKNVNKEITKSARNLKEAFKRGDTETIIRERNILALLRKTLNEEHEAVVGRT